MRRILIISFVFCAALVRAQVNSKVIDLPTATDLVSAYVPITQGGVTKRAPSTLFGSTYIPSLSGQSGKFLTNNGTSLSWGTVTAPAWGAIAGTLSSQADLVAALAAKIGLTSLSATSPLGYNNTTGVFSIAQATTSTNGYLSNTDWNTFNGKQSAISLTTTGSSGAATFASNVLNIPTYTLAGLGGIGLTSLSASSPLSYNNTTGAFTISQSNTSTSGYLSNTDWNTFNGKQPAGNYITALTGDITASGPGSAAATLATVNSNVGTFGSATQSLTATVNAKGLITAISEHTVTPAVGSITGLGTGVSTWLATPSWTNFNSAITGTAPYWSLASGGTLTGPNTITANTMGWLNFSGIATATANNQNWLLMNPVSTMRSTASDAFQSIILKPQINTAANTQNIGGVIVDADLHLTGAVNTLTALQSNTTTGCTNGTTTAFSGYTYTNQDGTGTSASGATFDVTVSGNTITSIVKNATGSGYKVGDKFLFNGSSFGGSGSVFIEIISLDKTLSTASAAERIIYRTYVPALAGVVTPTNKFLDFQVLDNTGTPTSKGYIGWYINAGSTSTLAMGDNNGEIWSANASSVVFTRPISGSSAGTFGLLTSTSSSEGFTFGTNLTGGIGTGKNFYNNPITIRPNAGNLKFMTLADNTVINTGVPTSKTITSGGTGYTNGTYNGTFTITGGSGTGLAASQVIVSGGSVTSVTLSVNNALNYKATDTGLTIANTIIGGTGSGLSISITGIDYSGNIFSSVYTHSSGIDNGSPNNYLSVYSDKVVNQLAGATGYDGFIEDNRSITSAVNLFSIIIRPTTALSGLGLSSNNPAATLDVRGNGSTYPAMRIASGGTSTEYAFRVQQSDVITDIFWIKGNGDTQIGLSTSKLGFYGTSAIAQQTTGVASSTFTANSGTAINDASTFDGYTIKQIVKALRNLGLIQ